MPLLLQFMNSVLRRAGLWQLKRSSVSQPQSIPDRSLGDGNTKGRSRLHEGERAKALGCIEQGT